MEKWIQKAALGIDNRVNACNFNTSRDFSKYAQW